MLYVFVIMQVGSRRILHGFSSAVGWTFVRCSNSDNSYHQCWQWASAGEATRVGVRTRASGRATVTIRWFNPWPLLHKLGPSAIPCNV